MKKLIVGIVVFGLAVAGGVFYWTQQQAKQQKMAKHFQPSPAALYTGMADQIAPVFDLHGYKIAMLVPGDRINGDSWVFRGTARSGNLSPAYYGQVDYTCGLKGGDNRTCWKLSQLVVDGRPLKLVGTVADAEANGDAVNTSDETTAIENRESQALGMTNALDTAVPGDDADQPVAPEGAEGSADTLAQVTEETDSGANSEDANPEKADVWRTTSDNVNARMGPGTDYEVAFAMPQSTPMQLIEQKDNWGHFSYVGPDGKKYRVWIYMNLVARD